MSARVPSLIWCAFKRVWLTRDRNLLKWERASATGGWGGARLSRKIGQKPKGREQNAPFRFVWCQIGERPPVAL